jgi:transcriptional regulator with XRE-family HTH domain
MFDLDERVSTLRKKRNLTQSKLAELLSISPQAISSWERGETMPDITKLSELADILGVSVDGLLGNTDRSRDIMII